MPLNDSFNYFSSGFTNWTITNLPVGVTAVQNGNMINFMIGLIPYNLAVGKTLSGTLCALQSNCTNATVAFQFGLIAPHHCCNQINLFADK